MVSRKPLDGYEAARIMYGQTEGERAMSGNLDFWNKVQETDPKYTKAFNRGGGFKGTSINPTYNNKKVTEQFGMCGTGWGWDVINERYQRGAPILINGKEVCKEITHVLQISFWYKLNGEIGRIPSFGQTSYVGNNKNGIYTDEEAPKKSQTDAITKALSLLGFSADVFLGMYDDVKYVNDIRDNHTEKSPKAPKVLTDAERRTNAEKFVNDFIDQIENTKSKDEFTQIMQVKQKDRDTIAAKHLDLATKINLAILNVESAYN